MSTGSNLMAGLVAGALIGAVAGLLLAPKPGKDMRKELGDRAGEYVGTIRERIRKVRGEAEAEQPFGNGVESHS